MGMILGLSKIDGTSDRRLDGASAVSVIATPDDSRALVLVSSRTGDQISKVGLTSNGVLSVDRAGLKDGQGELRGAGDSVITEIGDTSVLISTASFDNAVTISSFGKFGRMSPVIHIKDDVVFDDPEAGVISSNGGRKMSLFNADSVDAFSVGDKPYFVVGGSFDDGVSLFTFDLEGGATLLSNRFDNAFLHLDGVEDVAHVDLGGRHFVIAVSPNEQGVSVMRLTKIDTLFNTFNIASGPELSLGVLTSVETAVIGNSAFVFVGGFGNAPITVFELSTKGKLDLVQRVTDDDAANIGRLFSMEVFEIGDRTYVAAGGDRGAISVFQVGENGTLTLTAEFEGVNTRRADPTTDIAVHQFGEKTVLIASGQDGDGIATYRFFEDAAGITRIGDEGRDNLKGREKGDILVGDAGNDRLKGKAGHDRILDGEGKDLMWGGSGRDVFEFVQDNTKDKIQDFENGRDLIDLSGFVERFSDLEIEEISDGVIGITHESEVFIVKGFKNAPLTVDMFDSSDFVFIEDQFL
ncbi:MAG: M10 family metallopeptidase C-terminal domain-containing protein [Pikeienuella sp.]